MNHYCNYFNELGHKMDLEWYWGVLRWNPRCEN